jgi:hypothetical protein
LRSHYPVQPHHHFVTVPSQDLYFQHTLYVVIFALVIEMR